MTDAELLALPFPTTPILDKFTRANEDPVAGIWTGPCFTGDRQLRVLSNELAPHSVDLYGNSYISNSQYGPAVEAYCTLTSSLPASEKVEFFLRAVTPSNPANWYKIQFANQAGDFLIVTELNDVQFGTTIDPEPNTMAAGDGFGVRMIGNVVQAYWRVGAGPWVLQGTRVDTTNAHPGPGRIGFGIVGGTVRCDDFGGGTFGSRLLYWTRAEARRGRRFTTLVKA